MTSIQLSTKQVLQQAIAHQQAGRLAEAAACCQLVLQHLPEHGYATYLLGVVTYQQGHRLDAIAYYQQALLRLPTYAELHNHLAVALDEQGQGAAAIAHYQQAIALKPDYGEAWQNLGTAYQAQGEFVEAIRCYEYALVHRPHEADLYNNLGSALRRLGHLPKALDAYNRAIALQPEHVNAHCGRADVLLRMGNFAQGWAAYEWRWSHADCPPRHLPYPQWDGTAFFGKTLLLYTEQGLGDVIQFIRYIDLVRQWGDRIVLELHQPGLGRLLSEYPGLHTLLQRGDPLPPIDLQAPLLSLPRLLGTTLFTIPHRVPYLSQPASVNTDLLPRTGKGLTVGVVWTANTRNARGRERSCPFEMFQQVFRVPGVQFYSLQKETTEAERQGLMQWQVPHLGSQFNDLADTAGAIAQLDLVITVDTVVAHLAGALNRPVWVLLPFSADWRWLHYRDDSPWYPSMRLFRQTRYNDWASVLERAIAALDGGPQWKDSSHTPT